MNIIGKKKRIAVIGKGTAGSISATYFNRYNPNNMEVIWYYDPSKSPQSVGEGSTLPLLRTLENGLDFTYDDLKKIDGSIKKGIKKINWGGSGNFLHHFPLYFHSFHFNANKLQDYIFNKLKNQISIKEQPITSHSDIDSDYILDCSGSPSSFHSYNISKSVTVNAAYITQCYWEGPRFDYTLTIARPYGWVFGIPLQNRCSIGYLYNKDINTLEEVKEDVKNVFKDFNLNPSENTSSLSFNNYYKKQNFTDRVAYNGNASFFLEPMEATSIGLIDAINFEFFKIINEKKNVFDSNQFYLQELKDIQRMISLHYLSGSKFTTKFWDFSYKKSKKYIKESIDDKFLKMYELSKKYNSLNRLVTLEKIEPKEVAQWALFSYNQNLKELDLYNKLDKLLEI